MKKKYIFTFNKSDLLINLCLNYNYYKITLNNN